MIDHKTVYDAVADRIIEVMNRALAADPDAVNALIECRVPCNDALRDDPEIQVLVEDGKASVGLLGILSGLTGTLGPEAGDKKGFGRVVFEIEDDGACRFRRTVEEKSDGNDKG